MGYYDTAGIKLAIKSGNMYRNLGTLSGSNPTKQYCPCLVVTKDGDTIQCISLYEAAEISQKLPNSKIRPQQTLQGI